MITLRQVSKLAVLVALTSFARADFLDGRCVNYLGQGVAGVNIDAENLGGGGNPTLINDGTDANGFFHVTIPAGTYRIIFNPPAPPASTDLVTTVEPIVVSGTANMGNVGLTHGVSISGQLRDPSAMGVAGVNIDVIDVFGNNIDLLNDTSSATGNFSLAVPLGPIELRFDTTSVVGQTLAPKALELSLFSNTSLGIVNLEQGFLLTAIVRGPGNLPIDNCDLDVHEWSSGTQLYTPGDNTNASGFVDTLIPAGNFTFEFCPPFAQQLVAGLVGPQTVSGATNLGIVNLVSGVVLSGTIRDHLNAPVVGADVDLSISATGSKIPTCDDDSGPGGAYQVVVPTGTFTVRFSPPLFASCSEFEYNVVIGGNTALDGVLPKNYATFCFGDGTLATPCPCAPPNTVPNPSGLDGCANSFNPDGARLRAGGTTTPDTISFCADIASAYVGFGFLVKGNAYVGSGIQAADGIRCVDGQLIRFGAHNAGTNGAPNGSWTYPNPVQTNTVSAATLQVVPGQAYYQLFYRNTAANFCTSATTNWSNAVWVPW